MSFELMFADGFQALGRASYSNAFHQCTTLGPKGSVEILPGQPTGSVYGQSSNGKPNAKRLAVNRKDIACENTLQLGVMLDEFAKAITSKTPVKSSGEMGRRDIRILEAIYASAKHGGLRVDVKV